MGFVNNVHFEVNPKFNKERAIIIIKKKKVK